MFLFSTPSFWILYLLVIFFFNNFLLFLGNFGGITSSGGFFLSMEIFAAQDEGSKAADALTTNSTQVTPASSVSDSSSPDSYDDPLNSLIEPATVEEQGLLMEGGFMGDLQSSSGGSVTGGPVGHQSGERRIADLNAMASPVLGNERLNEQGAQSNSSFQEAISSNQHLSQRTQSQLPSFSQQRPVVTSFNYIHGEHSILSSLERHFVFASLHIAIHMILYCLQVIELLCMDAIF